MEERSPGALYWVDRRKNILKLAHGEFVSLWRLEAMFQAHSDIQQVRSRGYIHLEVIQIDERYSIYRCSAALPTV